jgi:hypothetical protein
MDEDGKDPPLKRTFVAFGDGSVQMGVCAKGMPKLPIKTLKRHLASRPEITFCLVQEAYSSQICSFCPHVHKISPCAHPPLAQRFIGPHPNPKKELYSVRACPGNVSGRSKTLFVGRDVNAARNMLHIISDHASGLPRPLGFSKSYWNGQYENVLHPTHVPLEPSAGRWRTAPCLA